MRKGAHNTRQRLIAVDYIVADPHGSRASRRMAAKEAKAAKRGTTTGHSTGGVSEHPIFRRRRA